MGAVKRYEKKQLASFYYIACFKYWMGIGLLVLYSLKLCCDERIKH
ncbi:hypothetical protein KIS4809_4240 [Bacillus sp. ZZV12-4809]|nr:hypothetical protein KIS4809_4240 [Bacillus sp. ZZV12-4809]